MMNAKLLLKLGFSIGLIAYLFAVSDLTKVTHILGSSHLVYLPLCIGVLCGVQAIGAYRWQLLAGPLGYQAGFWVFFRIYMLGNFLSLFLPGSIGGDVGRVISLARHCGQPKRLAVASLIAEHCIGLLALLLITAWMGQISQIGHSAYFPLQSAICLMALAMLAGFIALIWLPLPAIIRKIPQTAILEPMQAYWKDPWLVSRLALLSLLTHGGLILIHIFIAQALGLNLSGAYLAWVYGLTGLAGAIPFSLNGLGIREETYIALLGPVGIPEPMALSVGLYWLFVTSLVSLAGGLPLLTGDSVLKRPALPDVRQEGVPDAC